MNPQNKVPDQQPQRPDPEHGKTPTRMGFFMVPVSLVGAVLLIGIGVRFITVSAQPDAVGYVLFVLAAALIIFAIIRIRKIATGKEKY
ncbi:hypothetical protein [Enteractinococcus coprophilus]|uniref:Uncharacterized protein n=1 Tax=Enteractinococcus coprophilus TaxID=1027633 RepID=A0A543AGR1_9MICC|nr:hypothetical protein [Enteractinococcus coprophilus]TQL71763.1 hypothetical protein FB556_2265 [Enteractinococcus coprophilus]